MSRLQITDFSPLKDLPLDLESSMIDPDSDDACFENIVHQLIANEDGSVTWENPDKDVLGNAMIPEDLCGGVYNKEDNTITWSKEAFKQHRESETGNNNGLDGVLECLTLTNESYTDNHMNLIVNHELQVKDFSEIVKTYHKVKDLFSSDATDEALFNSYVPLAANITQDQIDKAKEQVNSLSDQEYFVVDGNKKTGQDLQILIQKAQDLFNQSQKEESATQTINIGGQGIGGYSDHSHDSGFSRVSLEVKDHKASLVKHSDYQFHWGGWKTSKYASIKLTDPNGNVLYDQAWKGNDTVKGNGYQKFGTFAQYDLPEGSTVEIYHAEGPWHRFSTNNNNNLKTKLEKTGYTYTYKMQNNQLVLTNVDEKAN